MRRFGGTKSIVKQLRINRRIKAREVLLIGEQGEQLGKMPLRQALQLAWESELDLVEMASTAVPPVCKLLDYGKYKYEQTKKARKANKGQKTGMLREMRVRPKIEEHDLQGKIKTTRKLLGEGSKVKVRVRFRGRERVYPQMGLKVLKKLTDSLKDVATVGNWSTDDGARNMFAVLVPIPRGKPGEVKEEAKAQKGKPEEVKEEAKAQKGKPGEVKEEVKAQKGKPGEVKEEVKAQKGKPGEVKEETKAQKGKPEEVKEDAEAQNS